MLIGSSDSMHASSPVCAGRVCHPSLPASYSRFFICLMIGLTQHFEGRRGPCWEARALPIILFLLKLLSKRHHHKETIELSEEVSECLLWLQNHFYRSKSIMWAEQESPVVRGSELHNWMWRWACSLLPLKPNIEQQFLKQVLWNPQSHLDASKTS